MRPLTHASRLFVAYQIISSVANELPEEQRKLFADFATTSWTKSRSLT